MEKTLKGCLRQGIDLKIGGEKALRPVVIQRCSGIL
jgi:hypothetical protein